MPRVLEYSSPTGDIPYQEFLDMVRRSGDRKALRRFQDATRKLEMQGMALLNTAMMDNIQEGIFELRVGPYRVFCFHDRRADTFVLLHGFRKQTAQTPEGQKARARSLVTEYMDGLDR